MPSDSLARIDDLNLARLNLISAQDQVDGQRDWSVTYEIGERVVHITCLALPEYGIPHGVDNDVNVAIIDYFNEMGQPRDGTLEISASHLLKLCGFHRTGPYYAMLRESLDRLHTTNFQVRGGWRDHPNRRWTTAKFHILDSLKYTTREAGLFDERTIIKMKLAEDIVDSIRGGYTKPLNLEFMQTLSRPRTRTLFRVLDATRFDPEQPEEAVGHFEVTLQDWAQQCKLTTDRPDMIRRALEKPHEELIRRGYLTAVVYEGRGKNQRIRYEFAPEFMPINPALLMRFRRHQVTDGVARQLARTYPTSMLMRHIDRFESLVSSGQLVVKKTAAAALVHLIKHPDQYGPQPTTPHAIEAHAALKTPQVAPSEEVTLEQEFARLSLTEQADVTIKRLSLYYKGKFSPLELDTLRHAIVTEGMDGVVVLRQGLKALAELSAQSFVDLLKEHLSHQQD